MVRGLNFRADMQIRPYRFHKFDGASGSARVDQYFREGMVALPYRYRKFNGASGYFGANTLNR